MNVLVVKDGTVPILVAEVLYTDLGDHENDEYEGIGDIEHDYIERFSVDGRPEALDISWADGDGFSVYGTTVADWLKNRQEDEAGGTIEEVSPGHLVQSDTAHGEDEAWYAHLFDLRGRVLRADVVVNRG